MNLELARENTVHTVRWALLGIVLVGVAAAPEAAPDKVEVKVGKYADLAGTIRRNLGRVVVVDFWTTG